MSDEKKKPPYTVQAVIGNIPDLTYSQMRRFAHIVAWHFEGISGREYEAVPNDEITSMAAALIQAAKEFAEQWDE